MTTIVPHPKTSVVVGSLPRTNAAAVDAGRAFRKELHSLTSALTPGSEALCTTADEDDWSLRAQSAAQVFNEMGLFGDPSGGSTSDGAEPVTSSPAQVAVAGQICSQFSPAKGIDPAHGLAASQANVVSPAAGSVSLRAAPLAPYRSTLPRTEHLGALPPVSASFFGQNSMKEGAVTAVGSAKLNRAVRSAAPDRGAITMRWDGSGVSFTAPGVPSLPADRPRLRDGIIGLIARFGFRPATVRTGGQSRQPLQERD